MIVLFKIKEELVGLCDSDDSYWCIGNLNLYYKDKNGIL